jgi:predicted transcriptional regulator
MNTQPPDVTETELAVLELLWQEPGATIRGLTDRLYPTGGSAHYATVQKLLERLEGKGFVRRDDSAMAHRFTPAVAREELIGRRLRAVADKLCGGSMTPLITSLVESRALTKRELSELRKLIDRLDGKAGAPARTLRRKQ